MKSLLIIGAGPFGRELINWISKIPDFAQDYVIKGFLDNRENIINQDLSNYKVIGNPFNYKFEDIDICLMGVADTEYKSLLYNHLKNKVKFMTFISPDAYVSPSSKIGTGSVICPNVSISNDTKIGRFVTINVGAKIGHDCDIKKYTSIMTDAKLGGDVIIKQKAYIGIGAIIISNLHVGESSFVGAGSVVINDISEKNTVFGNPAKRIKSN